jgi:hypothetical protein
MTPITRSNIRPRVAKRLASYTALAGAFLAAPQIAKATVVYVDLTSAPIAIPTNNERLYLNFVTGDFDNESVSGWDFNAFGQQFLLFAAQGNKENLSAFVFSNFQVAALTAGTLISSASPFATGGLEGNPAFYTTQNSAYIGMEFRNEATGQIDYGWVLLSTTGPNGVPASVIGYAYENTGQSVLAGQTSDVPEPSTAALFGIMAAGAAGVRAWRKRKGV